MMLKKRLSIFIISLLATLVLLRVFLIVSPSTNLNVGKYSIHHLYLGAFLIIAIAVFLILEIVNNLVIILAGISSALVLDEIVYLIATDGSDVSYLSYVSLLGAIILTVTILVLAIVLYNQQKTN